MQGLLRTAGEWTARAVRKAAYIIEEPAEWENKIKDHVLFCSVKEQISDCHRSRSTNMSQSPNQWLHLLYWGSRMHFDDSLERNAKIGALDSSLDTVLPDWSCSSTESSDRFLWEAQIWGFFWSSHVVSPLSKVFDNRAKIPMFKDMQSYRLVDLYSEKNFVLAGGNEVVIFYIHI